MGNTEEANMPAIVVPILLGIPVLFVGGYFIVHAWK
jgi:hypothetical protein